MFGVPERRLRDCKESSYFLQFAGNQTSQGGEDGILQELFRLVGITARPYCVEIGAWDGKHLSNTYRLVYESGWAGLLVEANAERFESLSALYQGRNDVLCLQQLVEIEGENGLHETLERSNVSVDFDFLSIDVDGADYHLWAAIGLKFQARVVCIEFNPTIPNHVFYVQPMDIAVQEGSSLLALVELGRSLGYQVVVTTTFNAIFVRQDLLHLLPEGIFTYLPTSTHSDTGVKMVDLNSLHNCAMATDIFQTYSGEIKFCGPKKLLWHRIALNPQQMQVIKARKDRVFPFAPPYQMTINSLQKLVRLVSGGLAQVFLGNNAQQAASADPGLHAVMNANLTITKCGEILGVRINEADHARTAKDKGDAMKGTTPLKGIAEEVLLNVVVMCLVTHRKLATAGYNRSRKIAVKDSGVEDDLQTQLRQCVLRGAALCEGVASAVLTACERMNPETQASLREDAVRWLERAMHLTALVSELIRVIDGTICSGAAGLTEGAMKLSGVCLAQCTGKLPWEPLLIPGNSAELERVECAPCEDVDAMLRGLYWKECGGSSMHVGGPYHSQGVEGTAQFSNLSLKWWKKVHWAEHSHDDGHSAREVGGDTVESQRSSARRQLVGGGVRVAWVAGAFLAGVTVSALLLLRLRNGAK